MVRCTCACGDWECTSSMQTVMEKELTILNRITWQREKDRGAKSNWKNSMEDILFAVKNPHDYYFNVGVVKIKRKVIAPYRQDGKPKDWQDSSDGKFRITYPSNFWDDISIPFWSISENTDHPTQKPEKLYAKLILASSKEGDVVFDPFLGSGTASVVAKKTGAKVLRHRTKRRVLPVGRKEAYDGRRTPFHPGLRRRHLLGTQYARRTGSSIAKTY